MKSKKIISGLLALTFVLGGTALPNTVVNNSVVASAATKNVEVFTYGDYDYIQLEDGTVEIAKYNGTDEVVEIPSEIDGAAVTSIGEHAFDNDLYDNNSNITSVTIPEGVNNIGFRAFFDCDALLEMEIPDGVKTIGGQVFHSCEKLRKVTMTDSVEVLGGGVFGYCKALESVTLSNKLTQINDQTFSSCESLKEIKLPSGIKSIGKQAFLSCTNLESINLPNGLETIKSEAFSNCENLVSISIPDSVTSISYSNFYKCASLTNVKLSANLTSLGSSFNYCPNLKEIEAPASLTTISDGAFRYNYKSENENKEPSFTLNCYNRSSAEKHALASSINFKIIDAEDRTKYPELTEAKFAEISTRYHLGQFRLNWTAVEGAEEYGIAVNLSDEPNNKKWKVQACTDKTTFTSPKLKSGKTYEVVICAKVNGKWDISAINSRSFKIKVK